MAGKGATGPGKAEATTDLCLPVDSATGTPLQPMVQPGYYPGYSTLGQQDFWDPVTRAVILDRVRNVPDIHFFRGDEIPLVRAVCDRLLPQDDRQPSARVPIVNYLDDRLSRNVINGFRYEDMPSDRDAYRLGLQAIEQIARHLHGFGFIHLVPPQQDEVLFTLHDGEPPAGQEIWAQMSVTRFWALVVDDVTDAYYSHPYAWDEIGFGGPAYPRGYMRLDGGRAEPWEVDEVRYEWGAPTMSLSGEFRTLPREAGQHPPSHQAGTH